MLSDIPNALPERILELAPNDDAAFAAVALDVFRWQAQASPIYAQYLHLIGCDTAQVTDLTDVPYLPISLFKGHDIRSGTWEAERIFDSSGTTGQIPSRHALRSMAWYSRIARKGFEACYGSPPDDFCWLALLPSYLERSGSSLVAMVDDFIKASRYQQQCGFFLDDLPELTRRIAILRQQNTPTILIGVSFALLDLAETGTDASHCLVMETGGMKGRRRELTRQELHQTLQDGLGVPHVASEYGMTELTSQAYAFAGGRFRPAPTMRTTARQSTDPLAPEKMGKTGALNIIDLGNLPTCSFIATDDLGRCYPDGTFEVLGRLDHAEMRGCNLMVW
jgi:hypothetical protein